jgi:hypothetical protein
MMKTIYHPKAGINLNRDKIILNLTHLIIKKLMSPKRWKMNLSVDQPILYLLSVVHSPQIQISHISHKNKIQVKRIKGNQKRD